LVTGKFTFFSASLRLRASILFVIRDGKPDSGPKDSAQSIFPSVAGFQNFLA